MGFWEKLSSVLSSKKREAHIICVGLDNSGKTTIMDKFKPTKKRKKDIVPTLGFAVENFKVKNITITAFDMSGQARYRDLWEQYYGKCDAIIFVIDSSDRLRIPVAKEELDQILKHPAIESRPRLPILFFANKCDVKQSLSAAKCAQLLELNQGNWEGHSSGIAEEKTRPWYICASNAQTGTGLQDGLDWISKQISKNT